MSYENKLNSGAIFKNDHKQSEKQPDYTGTINVDGKEKQIGLWVKEGKKGKFFSVAISEPFKKEEKTFVETKDDLPF